MIGEMDSVERLRRSGRYGWSDAWLLHRRLLAERPDQAIQECLRLLGSGVDGRYTACAAVAWSAAELAGFEAELEPVVSHLAETLTSDADDECAALTLAMLASAGLTLPTAQEPLCRLVAADRTGSRAVRFALTRLAEGGRLLPAAGELLLASELDAAAEIADVVWGRMPLTETARAILTAQLDGGSRARVARAERMLGRGGGDQRPSPEPVTRSDVDEIAGDAAADDLAVRIRTVARLYRGARQGANLDRALPGLSAALADQRRPPRGLAGVLGSTASVSWYAACALGTAVATSADPGAVLDELRRGLAQRRRGTRHAAAIASGVAAAALGRCDPLAAVLSRDEPHLVHAAMAGVAEGLRHHDSGLTVPALVDWLVASGFDPAWCFPSETATRLLGPHLRASTRDGLGQLIDALAGPRREDALRALAVVAANGADVADAVPVIAGTLLCGDWWSPAWKVLDCLAAVAATGARVVSAAPWLSGHLVPGDHATTAATTVVEAAVIQGADPAPFVDGLTALADRPFVRSRPGASIIDPVLAGRTAARTLARLAGQDLELDADGEVAR